MVRKSKLRKIVLENGIRLLLIPEAESLATTVMITVEAGAKHENEIKSGISHFLEHMCFKGTAKRPKPVILAAELDGMGADYNAFTGYEATTYYAKVRNEMAEDVLDIIADLYANPLLDEKEIEKEKGVIIEEINMYEDMPAEKVHDLFYELLYPNQPMGRPITGTKKTVTNISQKDIAEYRAKKYITEATIVVVAGGFNPRKIIKAVKEKLGNLPNIGKKTLVPKVKDVQTKPHEVIFRKECDQTHLIVGFRAFGWNDKRRFAFNVLSDILGGGMSSRLFQRVREEMGAAYYINTMEKMYNGHGFFAINAGIDKNKIIDVMKAIGAECARIKKENITKEELARAKDHLIGNFFLSLETSDKLGYFYGGEELRGREMETPEEVARKVKQVTIEEVKNIAQFLLKETKMNIAVVGPVSKKSYVKYISL